MNMNLGELIAWLTELQKVCPDDTSTNVSAVKLKGTADLVYGPNDYGYSRRDAKRDRSLSIWIEGYEDRPYPAPEGQMPIDTNVLTR